MSLRRFIMLVGAVALIAGVVGLLTPVSITPKNRNNFSCGNAMHSNMSAAREQDAKNIDLEFHYGGITNLLGEANYAGDCASSLASRRAWSIPLAAVGAITVAGALLVRRKPQAS